jgi:hypothetical protein
MGLLPVFLTLALFIFLWGLVNYNSFVAKRDRIRQLEEEEESLNNLLKENTQRLSGIISGEFRVAIPDSLNIASSDHAINSSYGISEPVDFASQWQHLVNQHSPLSADEQVRNLLKGLEEAAALLFRTRSRLEAAVGDYNQHRQQMPYRLIAAIFGFRPIQ